MKINVTKLKRRQSKAKQSTGAQQKETTIFRERQWGPAVYTEAGALHNKERLSLFPFHERLVEQVDQQIHLQRHHLELVPDLVVLAHLEQLAQLQTKRLREGRDLRSKPHPILDLDLELIRPDLAEVVHQV